MSISRMAWRFFIRGGTRQAYLGPNLTDQEKATITVKISKDNALLLHYWSLSCKMKAQQKHENRATECMVYKRTTNAEKLCT